MGWHLGRRREQRGYPWGRAEKIQHLCTLPSLRPKQPALEDHSQSQTVASAPENSAKNRYRNVLPCESRASADFVLSRDFVNIPGLTLAPYYP